jgi:hypothetical protein
VKHGAYDMGIERNVVIPSHNSIHRDDELDANLSPDHRFMAIHMTRDGLWYDIYTQDYTVRLDRDTMVDLFEYQLLAMEIPMIIHAGRAMEAKRRFSKVMFYEFERIIQGVVAITFPSCHRCGSRLLTVGFTGTLTCTEKSLQEICLNKYCGDGIMGPMYESKLYDLGEVTKEKRIKKSTLVSGSEDKTPMKKTNTTSFVIRDREDD